MRALLHQEPHISKMGKESPDIRKQWLLQERIIGWSFFAGEQLPVPGWVPAFQITASCVLMCLNAFLNLRPMSPVKEQVKSFILFVHIHAIFWTAFMIVDKQMFYSLCYYFRHIFFPQTLTVSPRSANLTFLFNPIK